MKQKFSDDKHTIFNTVIHFKYLTHASMEDIEWMAVHLKIKSS